MFKQRLTQHGLLEARVLVLYNRGADDQHQHVRLDEK